MSGGSWNYSYQRLDDIVYKMAGSLCPHRRALAKRLELVKEALHDIEWVDSNDYGPRDELPAIEAALGDNADEQVLAVLIEDAEKAAAALDKALEKARVRT